MSDIEKIGELIQRGDQLFMGEQYPDAKEKYTEALSLNQDPEKTKYLEKQIAACEPQTNLPATTEKQELSPEKKNWFKKKFGGGGFNIGKELMGVAVKKLLPKIKPIIEKNKPKALAYMRGEIDMKGNPVEETPKKRIIIIEYTAHPSGNKDLDDVIVQIKTADMVRIQTAKNKEGQDLSHQHAYSATQFIQMILDTNIDEIAKEMEESGEM